MIASQGFTPSEALTCGIAGKYPPRPTGTPLKGNLITSVSFVSFHYLSFFFMTEMLQLTTNNYQLSTILCHLVYAKCHLVYRGI